MAGRGGAWRGAFVVMLACTWCGNQFSPLLLMYEQREHLSASVVTVFLGVYVLGLAPTFLLSGALADRYGRRPLMTAAVVSAVLASSALLLGSVTLVGLVVGRLLSGVTVGLATSVGSSWLKELSAPPYDPGASSVAGARRASLAFAIGSLTGAAVAGSIAQWGPWPEQLPFLLHIAVTLVAAPALLRTPETLPARGFAGSYRIPAAAHRRFVRVVVVAAPWIFASAALAYGYLPVLLAHRAGHLGIAFATLLTVLALGATSLVQPLAKRVDSDDSARGLVVGLTLITGGLLVMIGSVMTHSLLLAVLAALVMGSGLGLGMVSGLLEVQRIATPGQLAGLTGAFYAVAYAGFLTPTLLAALTRWATPTVLLTVTAGAAIVSLGAVLTAYRSHLPAAAGAPVLPTPAGAAVGSLRTGR